MGVVCRVQTTLWLLICWFVCFSQCHLCLIVPRQRGEMDVSKANSPTCLHHGQECGGIPPEFPPKIVLEGGKPMFVKWQQNSNRYNIGYPGYMDIAIAVANNGDTHDEGDFDDPFQTLTVVPDIDEYDPNHQKNYTAVVTVPNYDCDHCVIRARYVSHKPGESIFYQCSDVRVIRTNTIQRTEANSNQVTEEFAKVQLLEDQPEHQEEEQLTTGQTRPAWMLNSGKEISDVTRKPPVTSEHGGSRNLPFSQETISKQGSMNFGDILGLDRMLGKTVQIVKEPFNKPKTLATSDSRSFPGSVKDITTQVTDEDNGLAGDERIPTAINLIKSSRNQEESVSVFKRSAPVFKYETTKQEQTLGHATEQTQRLRHNSEQTQRFEPSHESPEEIRHTPEQTPKLEHTPAPAQLLMQTNEQVQHLGPTPEQTQIFYRTVSSQASNVPAPQIYGMTNEDENFVGATYYQFDLTTGERKMAGALDFNVDSPFKPQSGNISGNYLANGTTNYVMDGVMTADSARRINVMPLNTFSDMDAVANRMIEINAFTGQTQRIYDVYATNDTKPKSAFNAVVVEIEDSYVTFNIEPTGEEGKYNFVIGRLFKSGLWQELSRTDNPEDTYLSYQWSEYDISVKTLYVLLGNDKDASSRKSRLYQFIVVPGPPIVPGPCFCSHIDVDMSQFPFMSFHVNWMNTWELFAISPEISNTSTNSYPVYHLVTLNLDTGVISDVMQLTSPGIFERYYGGAIINGVDTLNNKIFHVLRVGDTHTDVIVTIDVLKKSATLSQPTNLRHMHNLIYAWNV